MAPEMDGAGESGGVKETGLVTMMTGPTFQNMMRQAMPNVGLTPERITRIVATEVRKIPQLQNCTPASFFRSVITCGELGLMPGSAMGYAYILPFKREATFVLGYPGAAALSWRSDMIDSITAHTVFEKDDFDIVYGTQERIHHVPYLKDDRGDVLGYYACIRVKGAERPMFKHMTLGEIMHFRKQYVRNPGGPWYTKPGTNEFDWMAKKTVFKQVAKLAPKADAYALGAAADDRSDQGLAPERDITNEATLIDQMMDEGAEVNEAGGFGAMPVSVGPGPEEADQGTQEPKPKYAEAAEGVARCNSPMDGGCVRAMRHKGECQNSEGATEKFE